ncbi:uncharacterized protein LOC131170496 [Hevea brasiliensis]|uniref:uncharacterized protein LOC131170496 n=1 Tax=Hevea brasiliensis TaxID=3981 RepID=UPI0025CFDF48|nr:uncharacterized protein LOC131170496 [Hevea brasiliensis]
MCNVRKGKSKVIVPNSTMPKWKEAWSSPKFQAKSHQFTANRCSEIRGVGAGISEHTGGSVSHATHIYRMLGRRPFPCELFHKTAPQIWLMHKPKQLRIHFWCLRSSRWHWIPSINFLP